MRRIVIPGVLVAAGAGALALRASQQAEAPKVEVDKLEDNLFVLRGAGGGGIPSCSSRPTVWSSWIRTIPERSRSVDEIAGGWAMPAKYKGYAAPQPARLKANAQVIFDESCRNGRLPRRH